MSLRTVTCYIASCDRCKDEPDDEGPYHWPSEKEAIEYLVDNYGWETEDGKLFCDDCIWRVRQAVDEDEE